MYSPPKSKIFSNHQITLHFGDSLNLYKSWESPTTIISDGGYGVLGFEGDTSDHLGLPEWYENHIKEWSRYAAPNTSLWFWNSEVGWAAVHPILEKYGWRYVECNIWNKGMGHVAGNVNTARIRRFPVVTEVCVLYTRENRLDGMLLKEWLLHEWKRSGLSLSKANAACQVKDAAVRKYLDQGHLWYYPPPDKFEMLVNFANTHGKATDRPYFSIDYKHPLTADEWAKFRSKFHCPYGWSNVWERNSVNGNERIRAINGKAAHLNQKPIDLMELIIQASTDGGDVVWEPFGGLFTASLAAYRLKRRSFGAEIDPAYYAIGVERIKEAFRQGVLF